MAQRLFCIRNVFLLLGLLANVLVMSTDARSELSASSLEVFRKQAEEGSMYSQLSMGDLYDKGVDVPRDYRKAAEWYTKSAEQGEDEAQYRIGSMYQTGRGVPLDYRQASAWYRKAAEQGHWGAQFSLGVMYENGQGFPKDYRQAFVWYLKSAELGYPPAQYAVGGSYYEGRGVSQDYRLAAAWYTKSAEHGNNVAQFFLGQMFANGEGMPQNYGVAYAWYSLAAVSGFAPAVQGRDFVASKLTAQGLAEAQTIAARLQEKMNHPEAKVDSSPPPTAAQVSYSGSVTAAAPISPVFSGSGSGFVITPNGHILTCAHVVKDARAIKVKLGQHIMEAEAVRIDSISDLALLKVSTVQPLPALAFAQARSATLGQDVFTVGFPNPDLQGVTAKLTKGSVSSLAGPLDDSRFYQISVQVQPGNSGGPLLDNNGNVVGVVSAQIKDGLALKSSGSLPQNINYAVKSAYALSMVDSLPEVASKLPTPGSSSRAFAAAATTAESSVVLVLVYK
ncbi:MAG: trypsin-like serine protease [Desulfobulbaceae bacterium]|nr:trypsin-like serine protease [Desulfobulbaceae bacterium]